MEPRRIRARERVAPQVPALGWPTIAAHFDVVKVDWLLILARSLEAAVTDADGEAFAKTLRLLWRYRPLLLRGRPTAFCHEIRIVYLTS